MDDPNKLRDEVLVFLLQRLVGVEHSVEVIKACLLANSPEPDELAADLTSNEQFLLETDPSTEKLQQLEAIFHLFSAGKKPNAPDA
jgi:hypothetical protein